MAGQPSLQEGKLLLVIAGVLLSVFGAYGVLHHERSVDAYCQTWQEDGQRLHDQWDDALRQAGGDPFAAVPMLLGAAGDLAGFFGKLSKVAPQEIEPDVVRYKEALDQVAENLSNGTTNILELVLSQAALSMQTSSVEHRIEAWTSSHCGRATEGAS